jgi:hypothetical protein
LARFQAVGVSRSGMGNCELVAATGAPWRARAFSIGLPAISMFALKSLEAELLRTLHPEQDAVHACRCRLRIIPQNPIDQLDNSIAVIFAKVHVRSFLHCR